MGLRHGFLSILILLSLVKEYPGSSSASWLTSCVEYGKNRRQGEPHDALRHASSGWRMRGMITERSGLLPHLRGGGKKRTTKTAASKKAELRLQVPTEPPPPSSRDMGEVPPGALVYESLRTDAEFKTPTKYREHQGANYIPPFIEAMCPGHETYKYFKDGQYSGEKMDRNTTRKWSMLANICATVGWSAIHIPRDHGGV
jgi:hypothetical protein